MTLRVPEDLMKVLKEGFPVVGGGVVPGLWGLASALPGMRHDTWHWRLRLAEDVRDIEFDDKTLVSEAVPLDVGHLDQGSMARQQSSWRPCRQCRPRRPH